MWYVVDNKGNIVGLFDTRWEAKQKQRELQREEQEQNQKPVNEKWGE